MRIEPVAKQSIINPPVSQRRLAFRKKSEETPVPNPPPLGGPLGLHPVTAAPKPPAIAPAAAVVDRMLVGKTRAGHAEVRMDLAIGDLRGTELRLVAGPRGLEATFVAATESARRVVEARLVDLARSLERRGLVIAKAQVIPRERSSKVPR